MNFMHACEIVEPWVLQELVQETSNTQTWRTVSRPLSYPMAMDRLRKRHSSFKACRIMTGVQEALAYDSKLIDFLS